MIAIVARKPLWRQHLYAAAGSIAIALFMSAAVMNDRAAPFDYIRTEIEPSPANAGEEITVRRHIIWHRRCEGTAWTEIVGPDRIVSIYDRGSRYPAELGETIAERKILLSKAMPSGTATYRGVIQFAQCGLTSRWKPIEVPYQQVSFEVRH